ncbi:MAG TPA: T9SS type A sorting domain-containing protein, partial [Chlamydiales bacterium]|nr:T9SS type A sorting domain-containing protein [Chlamydiales bacterium]
LTATNTSGGGLNPAYAFANDRLFNNLLQTESPDKQLAIAPATLHTGDNWLYVRMRTSDICYSMQTGIDSIKIAVSTITGITDIDFPNTTINIYPNPFKQIVHINGLNNLKTYGINVVNSAGHTIFSGTYTGSRQIGINIPASGAGLYFLSLFDDKKKLLIGTAALFRE